MTGSIVSVSGFSLPLNAPTASGKPVASVSSPTVICGSSLRSLELCRRRHELANYAEVPVMPRSWWLWWCSCCSAGLEAVARAACPGGAGGGVPVWWRSGWPIRRRNTMDPVRSAEARDGTASVSGVLVEYGEVAGPSAWVGADHHRQLLLERRAVPRGVAPAHAGVSQSARRRDRHRVHGRVLPGPQHRIRRSRWSRSRCGRSCGSLHATGRTSGPVGGARFRRWPIGLASWRLLPQVGPPAADLERLLAVAVDWRFTGHRRSACVIAICAAAGPTRACGDRRGREPCAWTTSTGGPGRLTDHRQGQPG